MYNTTVSSPKTATPTIKKNIEVNDIITPLEVLKIIVSKLLVVFLHFPMSGKSGNDPGSPEH